MPLPVSLQQVIDEMDSQGELIDGYINRQTGELTIVTDEQKMELRLIEDEENDRTTKDLPGWMGEIMPKIKEILHSDDFIPLPPSYEINDYAIMKDFCYTVENPVVKEELLVGIDGRGAFRMFKELIFRHDLCDDWYTYKNQALKPIAINFLNANDIPFEDDCGQS